ncbi:hypothetical protein, partial [Neisseria meningitidis]|uniref:hypothetical protein n=1 Tax=Neisseria meningitidis TaxID=487 RepID=UPI0021ABD070
MPSESLTKSFRRHFRKSGIIKAINLIFMVLSNIYQLNIVKRGVKLKLRPLQNSQNPLNFHQ